MSKIKDIIKSEKFQEELKKAIESGKDTDCGYDPETGDEECYDIFQERVAVEAVTELLIKYFVKTGKP